LEQVPTLLSGVICCTHGDWSVSCRLCDRFLAESGGNRFQHYSRELSAVRTATGTFHADCDRFLAESGWNRFQPDSARKRSHNLHETYQLPCVQQITPDDGHRRCPKHVEFYDKINFGYLVHLVGCFKRNVSRCTVTWTWSMVVE
jgi:hypothetical protein